MKTNREKNLEHDQKQNDRVRPKQPNWNFQPLDEAIRKMILNKNHE